MEYSKVVDYFFSQLPMFSKSGKKAIVPKLDNIRNLLKMLDVDLTRSKFIHVAGTNGKGSTCHIIAATLQESGLKVGLLTSPHLVDLRERVKINGEWVKKDIVIDFVEKLKNLEDQFQPSYFEMAVALAFYAFDFEKVDIAVIETGLGGRWDSTNIITPLLSVITSIDYDHTDILGETLAEIASEKAGIIKPKVPVVIGKKQDETSPVFTQFALINQSQLYFAEDFFVPISISGLPINTIGHQFKYFYETKIQEKYLIKTDLLGHYQWDNIRTAWAALRVLENLGIGLNDDHFFNAIHQVKSLTNFRGRWDIYSEQIILDVAHNPEGIKAAISNLKDVNKKLLIVYGSVKDKDVSTCVTYMPINAKYFLTQAQVPRALPVAELSDKFSFNSFKNFNSFETVESAVSNAIKELDDDSLLIILGSFFVVGEAYEYLDKHFSKKV